MYCSKKNFVLVVTLILAASNILYAQPEISGYYEHNLQGVYSEESEEIILDASKLRLDFSSGGGDNELEFRGSINFIQYHSQVQYDIRPFLPESISQQLPIKTVQLDESRIYLDNAFLTWRNNNLRFRAGKQQLSWGTGYSFNPTDLFHKKDIIDPAYEKEGVTAFRLDYRWGIGGQITLIAAPATKLKDTGYAIRMGTHIEAIGYDIAVTAHQVSDSTAIQPLLFTPIVQKRQAIGLELSGELLGLGVWFEGNVNLMEEEDDFHRAVFGLDYTLNNGLYMMAEVLINTRAEDETPYPIHDWAANILYGEPVTSAWALLGIKKDITALTSASFYVFAARDGSYMLNPRLNISIAQNAEATIFGGITQGDDDGAFPPGLSNAFLRVNVYF